MARVALGIGALLAAGVVAAGAHYLWQKPPTVREEVAASRPRLSLAPVPSPAALPARSVARVPAKKPVSTDSMSRTQVELIALEEEALRRIDVVPVLEAAGVDVKALRARPDAADILRHVAGDELLTRGYMRDYFTTQIYPYGYPVDQAMRDARAAAEGQVAELDPAARVQSLTSDLELPDSDLPKPEVYTKDSGRIYMDPSQQATEQEASDTR